MQLDEVKITNFKGLQNVSFRPTAFACLVGENNAGKSSVLQAIVYALNRPAQLPENLFYDPATPVEFTLRFVDVTVRDLARLAPEHRDRIVPIVINGVLTLIVRYVLGQKVDVRVIRLFPRDVRYRSEAIDVAFAGSRGAAVLEILQQQYPEFADEADAIRTIAAAKAHVANQVSRLPIESFVEEDGPLPSGIATSISTLLPEAIYIPAVKNLTDDLKTTQSTPFGRLLGLLLEDLEPSLAQINDALLQLDRIFNRVAAGEADVDNRHQCVRDLEGLVESMLAQNFPRARIELRIPPPELKTILSSAQIYIDDGSRDLIDNKGDGIKRSLTFALLQAYVHQLELRRQRQQENQEQQAQQAGGVVVPAHQPLLFLFEEPELYLHPKSQRTLFATLARISAAHQVMVTTHSPLFFEPGVTAAFVRVSKEDRAPNKPVGRLYPVNFLLDQALAETFRLARFENADAAFFSRRIVLFEGESDDAYCRHVAKLMNPQWDFNEKNVAMVRVSGKGNFSKFRDFFSAFGIEVKLVADLDALFDGYQHLGGSRAAEAIRGAVLQAVDARINAAEIKAEPSKRQIQSRVNQDSWRNRYEAAKTTLRTMQQTRVIDDAALASLDELFTWEQNIARVRACMEDALAAAALVPLLDALRHEGICVLARGAIEDYYPANAPISGPKPERALAAATIVETAEDAGGLCAPLGHGRESELHEVFDELFRGI
ncbi:hypothetical protein LMG24238_03237 [Paraburkholderia sediminicola]|uniref:ATP-dependent endonuclease of OLD family n=1 Tax=Paraburkholderia sediminicola TaxID=458836 RepID=A0A6J5B5Y6_9BURK|nr:AAA family ATPase [Paraburkholderia sediminicola]CAB3693459.1 hypothetical protein LMG24238_03237 [Paraburkholderia sediminicola]